MANSHPAVASKASAGSCGSGFRCASTVRWAPSSASMTAPIVVSRSGLRSVTCWPIPRYSRSKSFSPWPGTDGAGSLSTSQVRPGSLVKSTPRNEPNSERSTDLARSAVAGE